jgi:hypothetical protein
MDTESKFPLRRAFTRVRLPITATVTRHGASQHLSVVDICLDGVGVRADTPVEVGAACKVELRRDDAPDEPWIAAYGKVVRVASEVAGIHFLELAGLESLEHLRALIMYHAEDPDQLAAEFDAHWGLRPKES